MGTYKRLQGVVHVKLAPGWKSYWREPGDSGIPPSFSFSVNDKALNGDVYYPTPAMIDDTYSRHAGYRDEVYFPFTLDLKDVSNPKFVKLDAFIGICEQICVPFSAQFELATQEKYHDDQKTINRLIDEAFADLPQSQSKDFEIIAVDTKKSKNHITFTAQLPEIYPAHFEPQLFIDGPDDLYLAQPILTKLDGNRAFFKTEIFGHPNGGSKSEIELYTLLILGPRQGEKMISFPYPG